MSNRFITGTDGRVRVGAGNLVVAGISKWGLDKKTVVMPIPHFESPVEAGTLKVYPNTLFGLSGATGSLEGYFDTDPTNYTDGGAPGIQDGVQLSLDLMFSKTYTWGIYNVPSACSDFNLGQVIDGKATFTLAFTVNGIPGMSTGTAT
jgi:hypothetical protein